MTTRKEFLSVKEKCEKFGGKAVMLGAGGFFGWLLAGLAISELSKLWLAPVFAEIIPVIAFTLSIPWMFWNLWRADKHQRLLPGASMPTLQEATRAGARIVIASRNCFHCGEQVIDCADLMVNDST